MEQKLQAGDEAPSFTLPNEDGVEVSLSDFDLLTVVLYFYPKDNTPGCTVEATDFTSLLDRFKERGAVVIGVSPDDICSHKKFSQEKELKHILLSDVNNEVSKKYFAYGKKVMYGKETVGIIRSTFVIKGGKILRAFYNVKAKGHAEKILELLEEVS